MDYSVVNFQFSTMPANGKVADPLSGSSQVMDVSGLYRRAVKNRMETKRTHFNTGALG
jgi:hypothetical protein